MVTGKEHEERRAECEIVTGRGRELDEKGGARRGACQKKTDGQWLFELKKPRNENCGEWDDEEVRHQSPKHAAEMAERAEDLAKRKAEPNGEHAAYSENHRHRVEESCDYPFHDELPVGCFGGVIRLLEARSIARF